MKWTEALVIDRIRAHYETFDAKYGQTSTHALLTQVPAAGRIIDLLVLADDPIERLAIEVKVSRSDYRNETDAKRAASWQIAHRCLYAAPAGLIDPDTLPSGWGLVEVHPGPTLRFLGMGEYHRPTIGDDPFTHAALKRCAAAEDAIRRGDTPAHEMARMRWEVDRYAAAVERAQGSRDKYRKQAVAAASELLAVEGMQECADCDKPVTWLRAQMEWTHIDPVDHKRCSKRRSEADRLARIEATGSHYDWGFAAPVEPKAIRAIMEAS